MALLRTNTGIGTTNPTSALHVIGDVLVTGVVTSTAFNGNINSGIGTIVNLTNTRLTSGVGTITTLNTNTATILDIDNLRMLSGIATITQINATTIVSTNNDLDHLNANFGNIDVGIVTNISGTRLNYTGVGTIATLNSTYTNLTNINSTGISTLSDIRAERVTVTGIVTANSFRPTSGYIQAADGTNSFYIYDTTGNVAFQGTIGVNQINNASGFQVLTFNNLDTRLTGNLDIAGVTTSSVFNGNIYSLGVSTFLNGPVLIGTGSSTGTPSQRLQVADGVYISGNLGVGVANPSSKIHINGDELVTGVITATTFNGQINAGVSTLGIATAIDLTTQQLIVSGLSTFVGVTTFQNDVYINGDLYVTDDLVFDESTARNINVTGVGTIFNLVSTAGTVTTFDSTTSTITNLNVTNSTFTNLNTTNLNAVTGVVTTISGTNVTYTNSDFTNLNANNANIDVGIVTDISGTRLTYTGVGTITTLDTDTAAINNLTSDYINVGVATATILNSGIGTIANLNNTFLNVSGVATITTLNSTNLTSTNSDFTNLNADYGYISVGVVTDISGTRLNYSGVGTIATLDTTNATIDYLTNTDLTVSGIATIQNLDVQGEFDVYDATATFHNNVYIAGNLSIGGTTSVITAEDLRVLDKEIILGITTNALNQDVSTDTTASHGGIAIASTEGYPLVDLALAGFSSLPATYKQLMWVAANSYGVGTTDAWMFNYAVGIGSTLVPNNVRLAVGNVQVTDYQINAVTGNFDRLISGIATFTGANISNIHSNNLFSQSGIITDLSGNRLNYTGFGTITNLYSANAYIDNISSNVGFATAFTAERLNITGVGTIATFNSTTSTITNLNVTNSSFSNVNVNNLYGVTGIVTTLASNHSTLENINSSGISTLNIVRTNTINSSGVVTAPTFVGDLLGVANYAHVSGFSTFSGYSNAAGFSTFSGYSDTSGFSTFSGYSNTSGFSTFANYSNNAGIATYAWTAGVSTYSGVAGVSTSVDGGNANVSQLNVTGVSTLGFATISSLYVAGFTTIGQVQINSSGIITSSNPGVTTVKYYGDGSNLIGVNAFNVISQPLTTAPVYPTFATNAGVSSVGISSTQVAYIPSSNYFGIGTTNPEYNLEIVGNARVSGVTSVTSLQIYGNVSAGDTTGNDGQYLRSTGIGVTWDSFPTLRTTGITTAIYGQTAFNFNYNIGFLDVYVNGVKLTSSEYVANNGANVNLVSPAFANDIVEFVSYNTLSTGSGGGGGGGGSISLDNLTDVIITDPQAGEVLGFDGTYWINDYTFTTTTATVSQVPIHTISSTDYRSIEYMIQVTNGINYHLTKVLVLHNGTTAYNTEYGTISTGPALATFDTDISGGAIRLLATPYSSSTMTYKIKFTSIRA